MTMYQSSLDQCTILVLLNGFKEKTKKMLPLPHTLSDDPVDMLSIVLFISLPFLVARCRAL